jgi:glutaredoxin-related protein
MLPANFDPAPSVVITTICKSEDLIKVAVEIDYLEIQGSPKNLEIFARLV